MKRGFGYKRKMKKGVITGADGPTSVFVGKRAGGRRIADVLESVTYRCRLAGARKKIRAGVHTLDELVVFLYQNYDVTEVPERSRRYKEERRNYKVMLVQREHPEWMEELRRYLPENAEDPENEQRVRDFLRKSEELEKRAASVPEEVFPMDFHYYRIRVRGYGVIDLVMEKKRNVLSYSASFGKKYGEKRVNRVVKEIFRYYGVTEEDIREGSERYHMLAVILAAK